MAFEWRICSIGAFFDGVLVFFAVPTARGQAVSAAPTKVASRSRYKGFDTLRNSEIFTGSCNTSNDMVADQHQETIWNVFIVRV